jgi:hypothetical protein
VKTVLWSYKKVIYPWIKRQYRTYGCIFLNGPWTYIKSPRKIVAGLNSYWFNLVHNFLPCVKSGLFFYKIGDQQGKPKSPFVVIKPHRYIKYYATAHDISLLNKEAVLKGFSPQLRYGIRDATTNGW